MYSERGEQINMSTEKKLQTTQEIRSRIETAAKRLGLDAWKLMQEYGVTSALAEMLERELPKPI
jgi:NAD(P)H-hydrate repair Nnr-like enzyme with NAD(P)H-hydrate epimerase domain